jgi:hypothetical protein
MNDWRALAALLLDTTGDQVAARGSPTWVRVLDRLGDADGPGGSFSLALSDEPGALIGWVATPECQAVGVIATGQLRVLGARPPAASSGVGAGPIRVACLVARSGEVAARMVLPDGRLSDEAPAEGRILDCLRRCFGLPTPPPPVGPARLQIIAWLAAVAECVPRARRPLSWSEVSALHPVARVLAAELGTQGQMPSPGLLQLAGSAWSWEELRRQAAGGCGPVTPFDAGLAGWMDEGMFARWLLADLPSPDELLAALRAAVTPSAARRLGQAVSDTRATHTADVG